MRGKSKVNYQLPRRYTAHTEPSPIDLPNYYNNQASPTYSLNRHPFSQGTKTPQFPPSTPYSSYGSQCRTISVLLPKFGLCATFSNSGPRYFQSNSWCSPGVMYIVSSRGGFGDRWVHWASGSDHRHTIYGRHDRIQNQTGRVDFFFNSPVSWIGDPIISLFATRLLAVSTRLQITRQLLRRSVLRWVSEN